MSDNTVDFAALRRTLGGLAGQVKTLRGNIENLRREKEDLAAAPPAKHDVVAMLNAWLGDAEAKASENILKMLETFSRKPEWLFDKARVKNAVRVFGETGSADVRPTFESMDVMIGGLLASVLRDRLAQIVKTAEWAEGLPLADRRARIAELDEQISGLQAQEAELVAAAAAAGVSLDGIYYAN